MRLVLDVSPGEVDLASGLVWEAAAARTGGEVLAPAAGIEEQPGPGGAVRLVVSVAADRAAAVEAALAARWPTHGEGPTSSEPWLDAWRAWARPVRVGPVVVRPAWLPAGAVDPGVVEVVLDPGRAFGSGAHATTRLALAALARAVTPGCRVLDVGSGSGVLAVAAARLGAGAVVAVDVDPAAREATACNAAANGVGDRVEVHPGDLASAGGAHDVVVANILAPVLVDLAPAALARLAPGGALVLAGLLEEQAAGVARAYGPAAPAVVAAEGGWVALVGRGP